MTAPRRFVRRLAVVMALPVAGTVLAACGGGPASAGVGTDAAACAGNAPKLTVEGSGTASAAPDLITVDMGIDVTAATARDAMDQDDSAAAGLISALDHDGVPSADIQTSDLSLQPNYDLAGQVTGYHVSDTLTAELHDFATAGGTVDDVAQAAGDAARIDSLQFSMDDPRTLEDRARRDAVHQAVSHAGALAQAAGDRLGPVCSLTDDAASPNPVRSDQAAAGDAAAAVPVQAGTEQVEAQVTLVYALERR